MEEATLPRLSACLDLYQHAYEHHGTDPFEPAELEWDGSDTETRHLLELSVAYGLLAAGETSYHLTCPPDAPDTCWDAAFENRVDRIRARVRAGRDTTTARDGDGADRTALTYDGEEYASIAVSESDELAAVVDAIGAIDVTEWDGVVLRSPGDYANEVQRYAETLEEGPADDVPFTTQFTKEYSDVRGTSKETLEYRVFLSTS